MRLVVLMASLAMLGRAAMAHDAENPLPLGDGMVSATPRVGYVMSCQTRFHDAPGAFRAGDWIRGNSWTTEGKPVVEGEVQWPNSRITVTVEGDRRVVRANNLPRHATGEFPVRPGTRAYDFDRNPNHIGEQPILIDLPAAPTVAAEPGCVPMGMIGFALSGVAIFNALDAGGRDAPAHEIQDKCNGHPEMSSQYHYHNWSPCMAGGKPDEPVGWMLDGFAILGPVDAAGHAIANADLDECHGRVGPVMIDGRLVTLYHYHFTREYPYTIGCFKGAVDPAPPRPRRPPPGGFRPEP